MKAIIFAVLISFFTPALIVITDLDERGLNCRGTNPFIDMSSLNVPDEDFSNLRDITFTEEGQTLPYITNETGTGVAIERLTPFGYAKQIGGMWYTVIKYQCGTGESFTDAMLVVFLWTPMGLLVIHAFLRLVL